MLSSAGATMPGPGFRRAPVFEPYSISPTSSLNLALRVVIERPPAIPKCFRPYWAASGKGPISSVQLYRFEVWSLRVSCTLGNPVQLCPNPPFCSGSRANRRQMTGHMQQYRSCICLIFPSQRAAGGPGGASCRSTGFVHGLEIYPLFGLECNRAHKKTPGHQWTPIGPGGTSCEATKILSHIRPRFARG